MNETREKKMPLEPDDGALINHLVALYARGEVELDDELFGRFLAEAPVELRAQLIEAMGIGSMNEEEEVGEDRLARLRALWERRLAVAVEAGDRAAFHELTGFAWWFGS